MSSMEAPNRTHKFSDEAIDYEELQNQLRKNKKKEHDEQLRKDAKKRREQFAYETRVQRGERLQREREHRTLRARQAREAREARGQNTQRVSDDSMIPIRDPVIRRTPPQGTRLITAKTFNKNPSGYVVYGRLDTGVNGQGQNLYIVKDK